MTCFAAVAVTKEINDLASAELHQLPRGFDTTSTLLQHYDKH